MNQNFSLILFKCALNWPKHFHNSCCNLVNHYETLKVRKDCSAKQIRDSFIKLSKENHPDLSKNPHAHKEFLKIQEAYNVLSKPEARASYDLGLSYYKTSYEYRPQSPWDDPSFYHNRDRSRDHIYRNKPYYGIKGLKRQSNGVVALFVLLVAGIAVLLQFSALKYAFAANQGRMQRKSGELQLELDRIRERAERNGNDKQLEILKEYFEARERAQSEKFK